VVPAGNPVPENGPLSLRVRPCRAQSMPCAEKGTVLPPRLLRHLDLGSASPTPTRCPQRYLAVRTALYLTGWIRPGWSHRALVRATQIQEHAEAASLMRGLHAGWRLGSSRGVAIPRRCGGSGTARKSESNSSCQQDRLHPKRSLSDRPVLMAGQLPSHEAAWLGRFHWRGYILVACCGAAATRSDIRTCIGWMERLDSTA
jgi:hypothetical protein